MLQVLKPVCLEPVLHTRSHCNEKPVYLNKEQPPPTTTRESLCKAREIQNSQKLKGKHNKDPFVPLSRVSEVATRHFSPLLFMVLNTAYQCQGS